MGWNAAGAVSIKLLYWYTYRETYIALNKLKNGINDVILSYKETFCSEIKAYQIKIKEIQGHDI